MDELGQGDGYKTYQPKSIALSRAALTSWVT